MINLLPHEVKKNITYAKRNSNLRHWAMAFVISIVGIAVITVFGLFYINQNIDTYASDNARIKQELIEQKIDDTEKEIKDISNNLKLTVQVLSREILFSKLIKQLATVIPNNTFLTSLGITKVEGGIDLGFKAANYNTASQILVNIQDPKNKIFDKADIVSITCTEKAVDQMEKLYPCTVTIRAQFAKSNPFLFINEEKKQ